MISGHIATTFVARRYRPQTPWWFLLAGAYGLDVLMFSLVAVGIEKMEAQPGVDGPSMANTIINMTYSHDLLPVLGWTLLTSILVWAASRSRTLTLVWTVLFSGHWLCDLVSGYGHFVFGPESTALGTDWYHLDLTASVMFESVFGILCVLLATAQTEQSFGRRVTLYAVFGLMPFSTLLV